MAPRYSRALTPPRRAHKLINGVLLGGLFSTKEVDMLLHLPIAILATLAPVAVSDTVPQFDIVRECRYEGGYTSDVDRCSRDEATALKQLKNEWGRFVGTDKTTCMKEATVADFASYVELAICLDMASEVRKEGHNPPDPGTGTQSPPQLAQPGVTVGVRHDPIRLRIRR
jgi:hypothetical protein